jgi:hypothetical protein
MPVTANMYYFYYNVFNSLGTGTTNNFYKEGTSPPYLTSTQTYKNLAIGPSSTGHTTQEVVDMYVSNLSIYGGGSINLSTSVVSGGFNTSLSSFLGVTYSAVTYNAYMALLVPDITPWTGTTQDLLATAHMDNGTGGFQTVAAKYTGGTITIGGLSYNLYDIQTTSSIISGNTITKNFK